MAQSPLEKIGPYAYVYLSKRMYTVSQKKTRQLSYRKEDRAMRPIYGCPEKFWESSLHTRLLFQKFVIDFCSDR